MNRRVIEGRAFEQGVQDGWRSPAKTCPHPPDSVEANAWLRGFAHGRTDALNYRETFPYLYGRAQIGKVHE
jgi:hypothetical protein